MVAYVDVWSASRMEDYSDPFIQQLQDMGAEVTFFNFGSCVYEQN